MPQTKVKGKKQAPAFTLAVKAPEPPRVPTEPSEYPDYCKAYKLYVKLMKEIRHEVAEKRQETKAEQAKARAEAAKRAKGPVVQHTTAQGVKVDIVGAQNWSLINNQGPRRADDEVDHTNFHTVGPKPIIIDRFRGGVPVVKTGDGTRDMLWDSVQGGESAIRGSYQLKNTDATLVGGALPSAKRDSKKKPGSSTYATALGPSSATVAAKPVVARTVKPKGVDGRSFASVVKQLVPPKQAAQEQIARAAIRSLRLERKFNTSAKLAGFVATWAKKGTLVLKSSQEVGQPRTLVFPRKRLGLDGKKSDPVAAKAKKTQPSTGKKAGAKS